MIKIVQDLGDSQPVVRVADIPTRTTFYGTISGYPRMLFLKTFQAIVSLSESERIWTGTPDLVIGAYRPVQVELRVVG